MENNFSHVLPEQFFDYSREELKSDATRLRKEKKKYLIRELIYWKERTELADLYHCQQNLLKLSFVFPSHRSLGTLFKECLHPILY